MNARCSKHVEEKRIELKRYFKMCPLFVVVGTCEYGNEISGSIKCGEFLD